MSFKVLGDLKHAFQVFQARLEKLYDSENAIYAYISEKDKRIWLINDPLDLIEASVEQEVIPQFVKRLILNFGKKFPFLLPHYVFLANQLLQVIWGQLAQSESNLAKFRWHVLTETAFLKSLLLSIIDNTQEVYSDGEAFKQMLKLSFHYISPQVQNTLTPIFEQLMSEPEVKKSVLKEKDFFIEVSKTEEKTCQIYQGLFLEVEGFRQNFENVVGHKKVTFLDFRNKNPFFLDYDFQELDQEAVFAIEEYEEVRSKSLSEKLELDDVRVVFAIEAPSKSFQDYLKAAEIDLILVSDPSALFDLATLLKTEVDQWNQLDTSQKLHSIEIDIHEVVSFPKRVFLNLQSQFLEEKINIVIECQNPQEKTEYKKAMKNVLISLAQLKQSNKVFDLEQIWNAFSFSEENSKLECKKLYGIFVDSIQNILFKKILKKEGNESWIGILATKDAWKALFEELILFLGISIRIDQVLHVKQKKNQLIQDESDSESET